MRGSTIDSIHIVGLEVFARHGVLPHEREHGQRFVVDVTLDVDLRAAAGSDDLADTIDYGALSAAIHDLVAGAPAALLETVAGRVADRCLEDPRVLHVEVTLRKPSAPVPVLVEEVAVTLRRPRP